jgi:hypothetical protein
MSERSPRAWRLWGTVSVRWLLRRLELINAEITSRHLVASSDWYFIQILCENIFRMNTTRNGKLLTYQDLLRSSHKIIFFFEEDPLRVHISLLRTFIGHFVFQSKVADIRCNTQHLLHNRHYVLNQLNTIYISLLYLDWNHHQRNKQAVLAVI